MNVDLSVTVCCRAESLSGPNAMLINLESSLKLYREQGEWRNQKVPHSYNHRPHPHPLTCLAGIALSRLLMCKLTIDT